MEYITYNLSYEPIQAKNQPLTQNKNETAVIFTHTCPVTPHTQYPIQLNTRKVSVD